MRSPNQVTSTNRCCYEASNFLPLRWTMPTFRLPNLKLSTRAVRLAAHRFAVAMAIGVDESTTQATDQTTDQILLQRISIPTSCPRPIQALRGCLLAGLPQYQDLRTSPGVPHPLLAETTGIIMAQDILSNKVISRRTMGETTTTAAVSRDISIRDPTATNPVNITDGSLATEGLTIGAEAINAEDIKAKAKVGTTTIPGTRVDMVGIKIVSFG